MKKLVSVLFLTALGLSVTSQSVAAQFLFVGAGPSFPMNDYSDYANTGFLITAGGGFPLGDNGLNVIVEGGWGQNNHDETIDAGKTNPITLMGGLEYDFNTSGEGINPYVYGGAGIMWHKYTPDTGTGDTQSAFGYTGGVGVGFPLGGVNGWVEGKFANASFDDELSSESYNTMYVGIVAGISIDLGN